MFCRHNESAVLNGCFSQTIVNRRVVISAFNKKGKRRGDFSLFCRNETTGFASIMQPQHEPYRGNDGRSQSNGSRNEVTRFSTQTNLARRRRSITSVSKKRNIWIQLGAMLESKEYRGLTRPSSSSLLVATHPLRKHASTAKALRQYAKDVLYIYIYGE